MTTIDNQIALPEPPPPSGGPAPRRGFPGFSRGWMIGAAAAVAVALGVGEIALAATGMDPGGWREGVRMVFVQHAVARALDSIGATSQQEAKIHDIIAARFAEMAPDPAKRDAFRKEAGQILAAPTIDRAAAEKLRAEVVAAVDAKSKAIVDGVLEIADQLTPEQRTQLMARFESMHHGMHDGHGPFGGMDGGADKD